ncbi:MAG: hypothetical protein ABI354_03265 [Candidatus Saccharimonadales bacterium]
MPPNTPMQQPNNQMPQMQPYQMPSSPYPAPGGPPKPKVVHQWIFIIPLIVLGVFALGITIFAFWANGSRSDYKNNSDKKVSQAVDAAVKKESTDKDNEFVQKEKAPLKQYLGPEIYGSLEVNYPKTWSVYVEQSTSGSTLLDAYFHPGFVPGLKSDTAYALHIQVTDRSYDTEMKSFESKTKKGTVTVQPYTVKNVPSVSGSRVEGEINTGQKDIMILVPIRDKTLKISSESPQFKDDLDNIILANIKFSP